MVDHTLTYAVTLENIGNIPATNVTFYDILSKNLEYVPNSFGTRNLPKPKSDLSTFNKKSGFLVSTIKPNEKIVVYFKTKILNNSINPIINSSITKYNYSLNTKILNNKTKLATSNSVTTSILNNTPSSIIFIEKFVNTNTASPGDTLTYSIKLTNNTNSIINSI